MAFPTVMQSNCDVDNENNWVNQIAQEKAWLTDIDIVIQIVWSRPDQTF